jgi:hypothetical protein
MLLEKEGGSVATFLRKQLPLLVESPGKMAFFSTIPGHLSPQIIFDEKEAAFIAV